MFPLYWICGEWKSNRKSPPVTVFRDGGAYKIALTYHLDAVVVGTIHQSGGIIWADLLGRVQLAYDLFWKRQNQRRLHPEQTNYNL